MKKSWECALHVLYSYIFSSVCLIRILLEDPFLLSEDIFWAKESDMLAACLLIITWYLNIKIKLYFPPPIYLTSKHDRFRWQTLFRRSQKKVRIYRFSEFFHYENCLMMRIYLMTKNILENSFNYFRENKWLIFNKSVVFSYIWHLTWKTKYVFSWHI